MQTILIILVVAIVAVLLFAATRPNTFTVRRSTTIAAPPDRVFGYLDDFHQWAGWSPWEKLDPDMARTHTGAPSGPGAIYEWKGNKKVGRGRMEITEATRPSRLSIKLDFFEPWEAHNTTTFTVTPTGGATTVDWEMRGNHNFMSKVMGLFMSMDAMVGKDFEKGLASLKGLAER